MKKRIIASYEEKIKIFEEYKKEVGDKIERNTVYKGYPIGIWKQNIRNSYRKGTLHIDEKLLERFKKIKIIIDEYERTEKTTEQEKYDFLMSFKKKKDEPKEKKKIRGAAKQQEKVYTPTTEETEKYIRYRKWLQTTYNRGVSKLSRKQIDELIEVGHLNYSPAEKKEIAEEYGLPEYVAVKIHKKYGSKKKFLHDYKKGLLNYDLGEETFEGARAITLSSNPITEKDKLGYYKLIRDTFPDIPEEDYMDILFIDLDELELELQEKIQEKKLKILKSYYGIGMEKYNMRELGEMYGVSGQRIREIIVKSRNRLTASSIIDIDDIEDRDEVELYNIAYEYYLQEEDIFNPNAGVPTKSNFLDMLKNKEKEEKIEEIKGLIVKKREQEGTLQSLKEERDERV